MSGASWLPVSEAIRSVERRSVGLYRIRGVGAPGLVYVGEGLIQARLGAHLGKMTQPENRQGQLLRRQHRWNAHGS